MGHADIDKVFKNIELESKKIDAMERDTAFQASQKYARVHMRVGEFTENCNDINLCIQNLRDQVRNQCEIPACMESFMQARRTRWERVFQAKKEQMEKQKVYPEGACGIEPETMKKRRLSMARVFDSLAAEYQQKLEE